MDLGQQIFQFITNPNVSYLLLIVGLFMLLLAVTTPGTGVAEVIAIVTLALLRSAVQGLTGRPIPDRLIPD